MSTKMGVCSTLILFFILFASSVNGDQISEAWGRTTIFNRQQNQLSDVSLNDTNSVSSDGFYGDLGLWYVTDGQSTPTNNYNVSVGNFFGDGNQLRHQVLPSATFPTRNPIYLHTLTNNIVLSNLSFVDFVFNGSDIFEGVIDFYFMNVNGSCLVLSNDPNANYIAGDGSIEGPCTNGYILLDQSFNKYTTVNQEVIRYNTTGLNGFWVTDRIFLRFYHNTGGPDTKYGYLDSFTLGNIFDTTNTVPTGTIGLSVDEYCIEKDETLTIDIYLDVFDNENDTIYYSTSLDSDYFEEKVDFGVFNCPLGQGLLAGLCSYDPDYNAFNTKLLQNGTCGVRENWWEYWYDQQYINIVDIPVSWSDEFSPTPSIFPMLELQPFCDGVSKLEYKTPGKARNFNYKTVFYDLDSGENISLYFNDFQDNNLYRWELVGNNTGLNIYSYNASGLVNTDFFPYNYSIVTLDIWYRNDTIKQFISTYSHSQELSDIINNFGTQFNTYINYIDVVYSQVNEVYFPGFSIQSVPSVDSWTSEKPTSFQVVGNGYYKYEVKITDGYHINDEYTLLTDYIYAKPGCNPDDFANLTLKDGALKFDLLFDDLIGTELRAYYQTQYKGINLLNAGKGIFWIVWFVLIIMFIIGNIMFMKSINLHIALITASGIMLPIAYLLRFSGHIYGMIIFLMIGIAWIIVPEFLGDIGG